MSAAMLDILLVALVLVGAVAFLAYRLRSPRSSACASLGCAPTRAGAADVVVGAALTKGLARAQLKRRAARGATR